MTHAALALVLALGLAPAGGVVPRPHPGPRVADPLLAVLEGLEPRPPPETPLAEPLGRYRSYRVLGLDGRVLGLLARQAWTPLPAFVIQGRAGETRASLVADRRPGNGYRLLNSQLRDLGRWFPLRVLPGAYEWRQVDETPIALLLPRVGTNLLELRGTAAAAELLQRFGLPVTAPAGLRELRFRQLHAPDR